MSAHHGLVVPAFVACESDGGWHRWVERVADNETNLLRKQLAAANREIERLRSMLGLTDESADAGHSWEPTLFASADALPAVNESSPNASKLEVFGALFAGRRDVYATRWENSSTGKSGWSPAVVGGWARAKSARSRQYLELTDEVLSAHLRGEIAAGVYPLLHGDRTRLLACDFDGKGWALDSLAYVDACRDADVPVALERSRSGDGAHAWTFFNEEVSASTARRLGAGLLRRAMARRVEIDLASYDRLFPSQDFMPKGSFGNLIALPLEGRARQRGDTVFLDPSSLEPWPDQWAFLSGLHRLSAEAAETAVASVGDFDLGPDAHGWRRFAVAGPPAPSHVRAQLGSQLSVERIGLPPALVAELKHLASLHNPVFYEKQKMRFSTWSTPRIIRCYEEDLDRLHVPRGLVDRVKELFAENSSELAITDVRDDPTPIEVAFDGTLTPLQQRASMPSPSTTSACSWRHPARARRSWRVRSSPAIAYRRW